MNGRYNPDGYIGFDDTVNDAIQNALATFGTQAERHEAYHTALKAVQDNHFDFSPGFLNQPYGIGERVVDWQPWPLTPYPSALWTVNIK